MMKVLFPVLFTLSPIFIPAQEVCEARPEAPPQQAANAPKLVGNKRQTFQIRFLRASDVLSVAQRVLSINFLGVDVDQGGGVGRKVPEEKNAPESALIGNTLLVADRVANTLIVHGPPKHIEVIRDLIAAIDVDLDLKKKDPKANPGKKFEKQ